MRNKIKKVMELTLFEWNIIINALFIIPVISISLFLFGYNRTRSILVFFLPDNSVIKTENSTETQNELRKIHSIKRIIRIISKYWFVPINCLKYSLIFWWILARNNIKSEIIFGIEKKPGNEIKPHAWIKSNNIDLHETTIDADKFIALGHQE